MLVACDASSYGTEEALECSATVSTMGESLRLMGDGGKGGSCLIGGSLVPALLLLDRLEEFLEALLRLDLEDLLDRDGIVGG